MHYALFAMYIYRYYFSKCSSELVLLPYSHGRSAHCFNRVHNVSVTIPRCYKDVYVKFLLLAKCLPLTIDLINGFKS